MKEHFTIYKYQIYNVISVHLLKEINMKQFNKTWITLF
jgi:hypothetical protein